MRRLGGLVGVALLGAACAAAPLPPSGSELSLSPKDRPGPAPQAGRGVGLAPAVLNSFSEDGRANVNVVVRLADAAAPAAPGLRLLAVPGAWQTATMTLFSPTASTGFSDAIHKRDLTFTYNGGTGKYEATASLSALRPAADYRAELTLRDSGGHIVTPRLAGSESHLITLNPGSNTIYFTATVNGQEAEYEQAASAPSSGGNSTLSYEFGWMETFAGTGAAGFADGPRLAAKFNQPNAMIFAADGTIYVADRVGHRIRAISPAGAVTTVSGSGAGGFLDGSAATAQFNQPTGLCFDNDGSGAILVADFNNAALRRVAPNGAVTTIAGPSPVSSPPTGNVNGTGAAVRFGAPTGVMPDPWAGTGYVVVDFGGSVRHMTDAYAVSAFANSLSGALDAEHIGDGNWLVSRWNDTTINTVVVLASPSPGPLTPLAGAGPAGFADGVGAAAKFNKPYSIEPDGHGGYFITDMQNYRLRRFTLDGRVTTVAGDGTAADVTDCPAYEARFKAPAGLVMRPDGTLYIADRGSNRIKRLIPSSGYFTVGDQVQIKTGLQASQPAVDHLDVKLSGACYGNPGSPVLVKRFVAADAAAWSTWNWDLGANNTANGASFAAATLAGAVAAGAKPGRLDFEAYDRYGRVIGQASLGIGVSPKASVDVEVY